jgi:hypothetical protein
MEGIRLKDRHRLLRTAIRLEIAEANLSLEQAAEMAGYRSPGTFKNATNPDLGEDNSGALRLEAYQEYLLGLKALGAVSFRSLNEFLRPLGVIPIALTGRRATRDEVFLQAARLTREVGELEGAILNAAAKDSPGGRSIVKEERRKIGKELLDVAAELYALGGAILENADDLQGDDE